MKKKLLSLITCTMLVTSTLPVHATGYPVFDISGWLTAIDQLYQQYDMVMNTITQIENQYQQIQQAVERAKSIDWDNIRFDGDFDIRNDIKDANKRVNKLLNQTRQIKNTLTSPNIDCGNGRYSLADLCGMGSPDHNFFSACKDVETYMTDSMKFSIDAIEGNLTEKQKMMIWRKYGISPKNYLFVQQSVAQVKTQASRLMAKATDEAVQLQREDRIAKTNAIIQAAYAQTDSDGNMTQGAANEASLSAARMINEENEKQAEADEMATFYKWGSHYAVAIGTIGLCWSAFKLANSRFTVKDFWWDTLYKWVLFILFMSIYPLVTMGMSVIGNKVGINAGKGKQAIIDSLTSMKNSIEYDIQVGYQLEGELNKELGEITAKTETITFDTDFGDSNTYDEFIDKYYDEVNNTTFNSKSAKKVALEKINEYREKNKYHSLFSKCTLKAIKDILVEKLPDGSDGDNLLPEYVDLNIGLKDAKGDDSYYLSPGAIMRVAVLGCQIMWEKNQIAYAIVMDEINEEDVNFMKR